MKHSELVKEQNLLELKDYVFFAKDWRSLYAYTLWKASTVDQKLE